MTVARAGLLLGVLLAGAARSAAQVPPGRAPWATPDLGRRLEEALGRALRSDRPAGHGRTPAETPADARRPVPPGPARSGSATVIAVLLAALVAILAALIGRQLVERRRKPTPQPTPQAHRPEAQLERAEDLLARGDAAASLTASYRCALQVLDVQAGIRQVPCRGDGSLLRALDACPEAARAFAAVSSRFQPVRYGGAAAATDSGAEAVAAARALLLIFRSGAVA